MRAVLIGLTLVCVGLWVFVVPLFQRQAFDVVIEDASGLRHHVSPSMYTITHAKYIDPDQTVVWSGKLCKKDREDIARILRSISSAELADRYDNTSVWDGWEMGFELSIHGSSPKKIWVRNVCEPHLAVLTIRLDRIVPTEHRMNCWQSMDYWQWNERENAWSDTLGQDLPDDDLPKTDPSDDPYRADNPFEN